MVPTLATQLGPCFSNMMIMIMIICNNLSDSIPNNPVSHQNFNNLFCGQTLLASNNANDNYQNFGFIVATLVGTLIFYDDDNDDDDSHGNRYDDDSDFDQPP